jgi:hypothetical protein
MDRQKTELEKYEHELAVLKKLKLHLNHVFEAKIYEVEQKIAECKRIMEMIRKRGRSPNDSFPEAP